jgi:hypothetical protein
MNAPKIQLVPRPRQIPILFNLSSILILHPKLRPSFLILQISNILERWKYIAGGKISPTKAADSIRSSHHPKVRDDHVNGPTTVSPIQIRGYYVEAS